MNPSIVLEFHEKQGVKYDLRKKNLCKLPKAKPTSYEVESISFREGFLWNTLNDSIKQEPTLARFKNSKKQVTSARAEYASNLVFVTWY